MKKKGILNAHLMSELTRLRHMDKMVICDAGFPVPRGAEVVDVSLIAGIPTMMEVLKAVLNELIFEEYMIFDMMKDYNKEYYEEITSLLCKLKASEISMPEFQKLAEDAKFFVRTGDLAPCSNILLISASGVPAICDALDICCL